MNALTREETRICVHVPCYNQRPYISEALDSVLAQTRTDYRVLIIDDHSTDGSQDIIRAYAARHPDRIEAILNEANLGIPRRVALALRHCKSEYFTYLDGDDLWKPDALEKLAGTLDAQPEAGMCYADSEWFEDGARVLRTQSRGRPRPSGMIFEPLLDLGNFIPACAVMVRRRAIEAAVAGLENAPFRMASDYYLWLTVCASWPALHITDVLGRWRLHGQNFSRQRDWDLEIELVVQHLLRTCPAALPLYVRWAQRMAVMVRTDLQPHKDSYNYIMSRPPMRAYRAVKRALRLVTGRRAKEGDPIPPGREGTAHE